MTKKELLKRIEQLTRLLKSSKSEKKTNGFQWPPPRQYSYVYKIDGKTATKAQINAFVKKMLGKDWIPSFERFGYYPLPKEACHKGKAMHTFGKHNVIAIRQNA